MNIRESIASKPMTKDETMILNLYATISILIFNELISLEAMKFLLVIMRVNNIAQGSPVVYIHKQTFTGSGMTVTDYRQRIEQNIHQSMMGGMFR